MRLIGALFAVLAIATAWGLSSSAAHAQSYPPPVGNCVFTPSNPNPGINQTITVLLVWTDTSGAPLPGQSSIATVSSQPGGGAVLTPAAFTTGADGTASFTLNTGDASGLLTLAATCGSTDTQVQVPVGGPPLPPNTGTEGALAGTGAVAASAIASTAALVAVALGGVMLARRRWGVRTN